MKIEPGESVILILQNPREKVFGRLGEINAAGVFVRGMDLGYFEEWTRAVRNGEQFIPPQDNFYPLWRIEKLSRDESSEGLPSLTEQFERSTGMKFEEF